MGHFFPLLCILGKFWLNIRNWVLPLYMLDFFFFSYKCYLALSETQVIWKSFDPFRPFFWAMLCSLWLILPQYWVQSLLRTPLNVLWIMRFSTLPGKLELFLFLWVLGIVLSNPGCLNLKTIDILTHIFLYFGALSWTL